jgi:hypothetical protein
MITIYDILSKYLNSKKNELIENMRNNRPTGRSNQVASGKTIASLEVVINGNKGKLLGAKHIGALENGRHETRNTAASEPTLLENIKQWILDKNLELNPYAVTKKIHQKGTELYRMGGNSGTISKLTDSNKIVVSDISEWMFLQVINEFNKL